MSMVLVESFTVGSGGAANITFSNIPQDATDLLVVLSSRPTGTEANIVIYFNSDTTDANYTYRRLNGNGSTATSQTGTSPLIGYTRSDYTSNTFASTYCYVSNYAGSANKSFSADSVAENNATASNQSIVAGIWNNTAAITSVRLTPAFGTSWAQNTSASLYKITKA